MPDQAASVLARLKNKAKAGGISYQQCLQHFLRTLGSPEMPFQTVLDALDVFLHPVWDAMIREQALPHTWRACENRWM